MVAVSDIPLAGKRILVRADLNVPITDGVVTNDARLIAALPTVRLALDQNAAVILMSHLGRPTAGRFDAAFSMVPIANRLGELLAQDVTLVRDWQRGVSVPAGQVALLENTRFLPGETSNDEALGRRLAALCDIFVMDAFGTAHRAHASTDAVATFAPQACAGLLLQAEINALNLAMTSPKRPLVAVIGGAKVSSKLSVVEHLAPIVDEMVIGGGMANTLLLQRGFEIGKSLAEPDLAVAWERISSRTKIADIVDVMVAEKVSAEQPARLKLLNQIEAEDVIVDIGPETARRYANVVQGAATVIWNGPMGINEITQFAEGTRVVAEGIADSAAYSVSGGGDTLAVIEKFGIREAIDYVSTGGGAFLEFIAGKDLPGLSVLR